MVGKFVLVFLRQRCETLWHHNKRWCALCMTTCMLVLLLLQKYLQHNWYLPLNRDLSVNTLLSDTLFYLGYSHITSKVSHPFSLNFLWFMWTRCSFINRTKVFSGISLLLYFGIHFSVCILAYLEKNGQLININFLWKR